MLIRKLPDGQFQLITRENMTLGSLDELAPHIGEEDLTLVLPASTCTIRQVEYQPHERKLLNRLIPFALEDELIDRVDDLHFIVGKPLQENKKTPGTVTVCCVEKSLLSDSIRELNDQGITPSRCVPELSLLPWHQGQWTVVLSDSGECLIRTGDGEGLACSQANLRMTLKILANEKPVPQKLVVYLCGDNESLSGTNLAGMIPGITGEEIEETREKYWQLLSRSLQQAGQPAAVNLLTGEFTPRLPWKSWWRQWRAAVVLLAAIGIVDLAARTVEINKLENLNQQTELETEALFRQAIPDGVLVDPVVQLQRRLDSIQGGNNNGFVALLSRAAPVIMDNPQLAVENLNYSERDREIQMTLVTSDFNTAESIRARLQSLGLQAELTGSSASGDGNRSRLTIGG